jgi:transketolase
MAVAQPNLNVKLVASHGGVVTGEDGASAQALEDLSLMLSLPNFRVIVPADVVEAEQAIETAARTPGPFYIRTIRPKVPVLYEDGYSFELGRWHRLRDGADVTLIATGVLVKAAVEAAELLARDGIEARVLNAASLKPADTDAILAAAADTGAIVTAEDHQVHGGLGSIVAGVAAGHSPVPIAFVGMNDRYGTSGRWHELLDYFHLNPPAIAQAARDVISRKGA